MELGSFGLTGLNLDLEPRDLPAQIFNDALNMDFLGTSLKPMISASLKAAHPDITKTVLLVDSFYVAGDLLCWIALTDSSAHIYYAGVWYDVTPFPLLPTTTWQSTKINGYIVFNNQRQKPFYVDIFDPLAPLKVYDVWPDESICFLITSLEGILIGCSPLDSSGTFNKQLVIWSDIADPGTLPTNFNYSDPTSRAGFNTLEGDEFSIGWAYLENRIQLYREKSVYDISYIGGISVFAFARRQISHNLLSHKAISSFKRAHFGIGRGAFFLFNGFDLEPVGVNEVQDYFFKNVNQTKLNLVHVEYDSKRNEVWIAYPQGTSTTCNRALIYSLDNKNWKLRELFGVTAISTGFVPDPSEEPSWSDTWGHWQDQAQPWKRLYEKKGTSDLIMMESQGLTQIDPTNDPMQAFARRDYCVFSYQDANGRPTVDRQSRKMLSEFWPESRGLFSYRFGSSDLPNEPVMWKPWATFGSNSQTRASIIVSSRNIFFEVNNTIEAQPVPFELSGYMVKAKHAGRY